MTCDKTKTICDTYGKDKQIIKAIEEMNELTHELFKELNKKGVKKNIIEEMADVFNCLDNLQYILNIKWSEVIDIMYEKKDREIKRIKK